MNTGHKGQQHDIFAYNGGLFAPDEILDNIKINDDLLYKHTVNLSNYDFESEVSVNILGHIFEHSLNDIDEIQAEIQGISSDQSKTKRKKDGVFYTPKYITKYIVDNTVGKLCEEKKTELDIQEVEYEKERKGRQKATLKKLTQKLDNYRKWLLQITICDPACGSGAFLNQALEFLIAEHQYIDELQAKLFGDALILSEVENAILENNIYGVDINEESVDIAKLSLWLRTAQKGRKLTSLNSNIKSGNSLIDDASVAGDKAFNWQEEFPEVFTKGGFDVIIGNPPYAGRTSFISDIEKKFIRSDYKTSEGRFELYQLFIERSLDISNKENSYVSLITPQTWLSIIQSTKLRQEVLKNKELFEIIFLGKDIFPDASVDTVIFIISKGKQNNHINYLNSGNLITTNLNYTEIQYSEINTSDFIIPTSSNNDYSSIEKKIKKGSVNLEKIGEWSDGVIVAGKAKDFAFSYEKTDESFFPMLIGRDVERYTINWSGKYCCRDKNLIEQHNPSAYRLREERMFKRRKILIRKTGNSIVSTIDDSEFYYEQSLFSFGIVDQVGYKLEFVQSILNSKLANFLLKMNSFSMKDTFPQIRIHWLKDFPIKTLNIENQQLFIEKTNRILQFSNELLTKSNSLVNLLKSKYEIEKVSKKLQNWHELNFADFLKELKKQKIQLTLNEESEWMQYFNEQKQKADELKIEIDKTDSEIDQMVYELYGLTDDEIKIVEEATA